MSPANLLRLYRVRLRARLFPEALAVLGIAAGVALLFASQVASRSLQDSLAELSKGVVGNASLQLLGRDPQGIPGTLVATVRHVPGVRAAAPVLEATAEVRGPRGRASVELIGADESLKRLGGSLARKSNLEAFAGIGAILLPSRLAGHLGVTRYGQEATLLVYGRKEKAPLYQQLTSREIGPLAQSPIVMAPLFYAQELTGLPGRVSRILVATDPGRGREVAAALTRLAAGHANVEDTGYDERLFANAAAAANQSTSLFAVISALVGFLFAFNATLLTLPQRRRLVSELRREGFGQRAVMAVLALDAVILGASATVLGLLLGAELAVRVFGENPGYLGSAFSLGAQRTLAWQSFAVATAGGMIASIAAVLGPFLPSPLARIQRHRSRTQTPVVHRTPRTGVHLFPPTALTPVSCLLVAAIVLVFAPKFAIVGMVALIAALLALLPVTLAWSVSLLSRAARRRTGAVLHIAAMELSASRARAIGVAATGAIAVFGAVAIQGAHADLLTGLENAAKDTNALTDLWVTPPGAYDLLRTAPFEASEQAKLSDLPGVRSVAVYRGGLLDWGNRKIWVIAPPADASPLLPASQMLTSTSKSTSALRSGTGVVLSRTLAEAQHLRVGDTFTLPAPDPIRLRLAGLATNVGWAPGATLMTAEQFRRGWGTTAASSYLIRLTPRAGTAAVSAEIRKALGPESGLTVQTAAAHEAEQNALSRQGLQRLSAIARLILLVAVLAMAAATASMVWQRRPRLAKLKLEGFSARELWATIVLESALLAGVGCLTGAALGLLAQQLLDKALARVLGFPVVASIAVGPALLSLLMVTVAAALVVTIPGRAAAGVEPSVALQD